MNRNPDRMSYEEIVDEVATLQDEVKVRAVRTHELGASLYRRIRRSPSDDSTAIYITYANAVTRFAGAVSQLSARTLRTAKVLDRLPPKQAETTQTPERRPAVPDAGPAPLPPSPMESLIRSYVNEPPTPLPDEG